MMTIQTLCISEYGNEEVKAAIAHFKSPLEIAEVEIDLILVEWQLLKIIVLQKLV